MKKIISTIIALTLMITPIAGCAQKREGLSSKEQTDKLSVITTLFPQYDFVRQIAKDKADVTLLLPPGSESHLYEPTPGDVTKIASSDLFVYTGDVMEPWAARIISGIESDKTVVVDASKGVQLAQSEHHHDEDEAEDEHEDDHDHDHAFDPHIWLDPTKAMVMVDNIAESLCKKDPDNADFYNNNAENYKKELDKLDKDFFTAVEEGKRNTIVFGGRFAFAYFVNRYGLKYESAYNSCSTEAEPSVKTVSNLINFIKNNNIPVIYYEEFVDPKVARSISEQTGAKMLMFQTAHNVSKEDKQNNVTFIDVMRQNLQNLKEGLK